MARDTIRDVQFPRNQRQSRDAGRSLRPSSPRTARDAASSRLLSSTIRVSRPNFHSCVGPSPSEAFPISRRRNALPCSVVIRPVSPVQRWWYRASKRALDLAVSVLALAVLSPILIVIALLVRIDSPGPCFFVQKRIGYRGRVFGMLKFRTMVDSDTACLDVALHKHMNDPRQTRAGRFLRATSLDEIPQLINVLRGEMSLVGPRPEIVEIALAHYEPWQYRRLLVPQGMTGWWQVTGRGAKLLRQHTEDDLYYIEHASLWFDIKILVMTVRAVLRKEGAF